MFKAIARMLTSLCFLSVFFQVRAAIILPIVSLSGEANAISIDLGMGPVSTGPMTISLVPGPQDLFIADVAARTVMTDVLLQINFPLLQTIGSGPLLLRLQEIGPVTWGIDENTGELSGWSNLSGGGIIAPGTPFAGGIVGVNNIWEIKSKTTTAAVPFAPPSPYPQFFNPYPPPMLLPALPLDPPFRLASDSEIEALLPADVAPVNFNFNGIFRFSGQPGDIPILGQGSATLGVPEPPAFSLLVIGILGSLLVRRWGMLRVSSGCDVSSSGCDISEDNHEIQVATPSVCAD
jgi:hypothetical protein